MAGKHAAPDRSRFYRELLRLTLLLIVLGVVAVGGAVWVSSVIANSDDTIPVAVTESTLETTTSVLSETLVRESTTTTTAPSTTTTSAPTTTTTAAPTTTTTAPTTTTSSTTTTTVPEVRQPSEVVVLVLNSTNVVRMAARLTATLEGLGYQTIEPDNYDPLLETSRIWYVDGFALEAEALLEQVPDAIVEPIPTDVTPQADITVVLGASFSE